MTWLTVGSGSQAEREAVLGLQPEVSQLLGNVLELSWSITDPALLEPCRLRMAQIFGCRAELEVADRSTLAELATWRSSAAFSERQRAALAYAEQFAVDQNAIADEQKEEIARFLSLRQLVNFVQALNVHDGYLRVLTLLDLAPEPSAAPQVDEPAADSAAPPAEGRELLAALTDPRFLAARSAFGAATARQSGVDELTTECCRLRNANHQACRY